MFPFYAFSVKLHMKYMYEIQPNPPEEKHKEYVIGKIVLGKIKSISAPVILASETMVPIQS